MWGTTSVITSGEAVEVALWSRFGGTARRKCACAIKLDINDQINHQAHRRPTLQAPYPWLSENPFQNKVSIQHKSTEYCILAS